LQQFNDFDGSKKRQSCGGFSGNGLICGHVGPNGAILRSAYELAKEKVKDILVNHQPTPLSDSGVGDLRRFVTGVEKKWGVEPTNPDFDPASLVADA